MMSASWNKVLQIYLSFVGVYSGASVGSVSCSGVWFFFLGVASGVLFAGFGVPAWCSGKVEAGGIRGADDCYSFIENLLQFSKVWSPLADFQR